MRVFLLDSNFFNRFYLSYFRDGSDPDLRSVRRGLLPARRPVPYSPAFVFGSFSPYFYFTLDLSNSLPFSSLFSPGQEIRVTMSILF